jgi:hypothetical protein
MPIDNLGTQWSAVIGRCMAFLCLRNSDHRDESLANQADFLRKLGLPLDDCAQIIGSTPASLRELARLAKSKKGANKNGKAKRR